jgi:hypothetical protein
LKTFYLFFPFFSAPLLRSLLFILFRPFFLSLYIYIYPTRFPRVCLCVCVCVLVFFSFSLQSSSSSLCVFKIPRHFRERFFLIFQRPQQYS